MCWATSPATSLRPLVMVTHHPEGEIPPGITHALLLRQGQVVAAGPVGDVLRSAAVVLVGVLGVSVTVDGTGGRWFCPESGTSYLLGRLLP